MAEILLWLKKCFINLISIQQPKSMINKLFTILIFVHTISTSFGQTAKWRGVITRSDGNKIDFNFSFQKKNNQPFLIISNGDEKIKVKNIHFRKDSVFIKMPVFESSFDAKVTKFGWEGNWIKGTSGKVQILPFSAVLSATRYDALIGDAQFNISGRWAVSFENDNSKKAGSIAEFIQKGNKLFGTFLTPTGDYRYLEGIVTGDQFMLSGFDGAHCILFKGIIKNRSAIINGTFYSGAKYTEKYNAIKDQNATVSTNQVAMYLKAGEQKLNFSFKDLSGKQVSINDPIFKNKVLIIQILGSWCPNCMDETAFLNEFYIKNKQRGIEIIGLAYEYSTDFNRSVNSLNKFKDRFNIAYPLLITGVTVNDSLRTEKTLPQVTPIKVFPSTILIDKNGIVRKFETGFFGPGTGNHYIKFKKEFSATIDSLLNE